MSDWFSGDIVANHELYRDRNLQGRVAPFLRESRE
jgi:hypothetical protein